MNTYVALKILETPLNQIALYLIDLPKPVTTRSPNHHPSPRKCISPTLPGSPYPHTVTPSHRHITFRNPVFKVKISTGSCVLECDSLWKLCSKDSYDLLDHEGEVVVVVREWDSDDPSRTPDLTSRGF